MSFHGKAVKLQRMDKIFKINTFVCFAISFFLNAAIMNAFDACDHAYSTDRLINAYGVFTVLAFTSLIGLFIPDSLYRKRCEVIAESLAKSLVKAQPTMNVRLLKKLRKKAGKVRLRLDKSNSHISIYINKRFMGVRALSLLSCIKVPDDMGACINRCKEEYMKLHVRDLTVARSIKRVRAEIKSFNHNS